MANIAALIGVVLFIAIGYALSSNRKAINWRTILWAFGLQVVFGVLILKTSAGVAVFDYLNDAILKVLDFQKAGAEMVFGGLASQEKFGYIFAFQVIPTIVSFILFGHNAKSGLRVCFGAGQALQTLRRGKLKRGGQYLRRTDGSSAFD